VELAEWARVNRVHPQTAFRWFGEDRMPAPARRLASGTIWVDVVPGGDGGRVMVYARVSGRDQRADLDRRVARLTGWAAGQGLTVAEVECGATCARRSTTQCSWRGPTSVGITATGDTGEHVPNDLPEVLAEWKAFTGSLKADGAA
jgi:hypothetical protein